MRTGKPEHPLFLTLDGMRGVGGALVVIGHTVIFWGGLPTASPPIPFCVDLFFLLSGFVIAFAYEPRFATGLDAVSFLRQRFVRLYPLYFLGLVLGAGVQMAVHAGDAGMGPVLMALGPQLLMLPSPDFNGSGDLYPLNMPAWTLLFELWANIVYVLIWRWLSTRVLIGVVIVSAVLLAVCTISYGTLDQGPSWWNFWGGFARAMFGFFAGVLVFRLVGSPKEPTRCRSWTAIPALFAVPVLCVIPQTPELRPFIELGIVCLIGPLLLLWGQSVQPWQGFAKWFGRAGAVSYACYVLHYPLFELMKRLNWRFPALSAEFTPWTGIAILLVALALSWWAEKYYDRPARRLLNAALKAILPGRKRPPMVAAE